MNSAPTAERRERRRRGQLGELAAVWWLRLTGWRILARGFTVGRGSGAGEVDIVARRGKVLAFVEVKRRRALREAAESLRPGQQRRIARAAEAFLARRPDLAGCELRFDALLISPGRLPHHLRDAWRMDA